MTLQDAKEFLTQKTNSWQQDAEITARFLAWQRNASFEELKELDRWHIHFLLDLKERGISPSADMLLHDASVRAIENAVAQEQTVRSRVVPFRRWRISAAAVFLIAIASWWLLNKNEKHGAATIAYTREVQPGRAGAKLKLSDGRVIMIDTVKDGLITMDGKVRIYIKNGEVHYEGIGQENVYNEIIADKGKYITAVLPDGSTVWLNAGSSIRYPLQFTGKERLVTMTGEASFRVIHNSGQPFRVSVKGQVVEDIGTEFNINAYDDEAEIKTTV
ncbi:MAG: FecR family protein, partial [Sediminibacterium sp.]